MSIRREPVKIVVTDNFTGCLMAAQAAATSLRWALDCPPELRGGTGPGPHLWEGDQA